MTLPGSTTEAIVSDMSGKTKTITIKNSAGTVLRSRSYGYSWTAGEGWPHSAHQILYVGNQDGSYTRYTYDLAGDENGDLYRAETRDAANALIEDFHYYHDGAGNRTKKTDQTPGGTTTTSYAYNAGNQLCWAYTGTTTNGCASPPAGATSYTYDANGHGNETAAGSTTYGYDPLDRATSLAGATAGYLTPDNSELVSFGTTSYQNNLLGLSRQFAPTATTNYVRDPSGQPVSQRTSAGKQFFLTDALGSTIALTDTTGSIVRSYSYDPDGNATTSGSGPTTDLKFAGGHQVGSLYHYGARYYDPGIARWTQQDPIQEYDDLSQANRYVYAGGDPVNEIDPLGTNFLSTALKAVKGCIEGAVGASPGPYLIKLGSKIIKVFPGGRAAGCVEGAVVAEIPK
jgi:RHS repeat-associated protein